MRIADRPASPTCQWKWWSHGRYATTCDRREEDERDHEGEPLLTEAHERATSGSRVRAPRGLPHERDHDRRGRAEAAGPLHRDGGAERDAGRVAPRPPERRGHRGRSPSDVGPARVRRSIQRRSRTRHRNPTTIHSCRWTSRSARRERTAQVSSASRSPATNVQIGRLNSSCAISATPVTASVPATADPIRHPNRSIPNTLIPSAVCHLPSGGWTKEPTSHSCSRNARSFGELIRHVRSEPPTMMHAAFA